MIYIAHLRFKNETIGFVRGGSRCIIYYIMVVINCVAVSLPIQAFCGYVTAVSLMKPPPGSGSGFKIKMLYPLELGIGTPRKL